MSLDSIESSPLPITDKSELMRLICENAFNLKFGSDDLRNDKEIVSLAMKKDVLAICHASAELQNDIGFLIEQMQSIGVPIYIDNRRGGPVYADDSNEDNDE